MEVTRGIWRGGAKVYEMMDLYKARRHRGTMLREAEVERLCRAMRAGRKKRVGSRLMSTLVWEVVRFVGLLRKVLRTPNNAG